MSTTAEWTETTWNSLILGLEAGTYDRSLEWDYRPDPIDPEEDYAVCLLNPEWVGLPGAGVFVRCEREVVVCVGGVLYRRERPVFLFGLFWAALGSSRRRDEMC